MGVLAGGDYWVREHQRVRAHGVRVYAALFADVFVADRGGEVGGQMPACGKAEYGHLRGVYMPLIRIGANQAHCLGSLQQSHRIAAGLHRIAQHEYGEAFGQELQGHWLGFAVRSHGVAAARQNQDGRAYTVRFQRWFVECIACHTSYAQRIVLDKNHSPYAVLPVSPNRITLTANREDCGPWRGRASLW